MKSYRIVFVVLLLTAISMAACEKPKPEPKEQEKVQPTPTPTPAPEPKKFTKLTNEVNVFKWEDWIYFSFKDNKVVEVSDPENEQGWDIGFHITDFRTNGGESGSGKGAAVKTNLEELSQDVKLEGLQWETDKKGVGIKTHMMKPEDKTISKNLSLSDNILKYEMSGMPPKIAVSSNVWLIKDAEGKVLEFKVISCDWDGPSGKKTLPMKFEYAYLLEDK